LSQRAGHDLNYISIAGVLAHLGTADIPPPVPLNLVGDFGGGAMFLVVGVLAAIIETASSGRGQVVDAAMVDGSALLMTMFWSLAKAGHFEVEARGQNQLDGGAPYYNVYECADGRFMAVGAIERKFYQQLLVGLGLDTDEDFLHKRNERPEWPRLRSRMAAVFATRTRDEWCDRFESLDACVSPVLTMLEAARHPHAVARSSFTGVEGDMQPSPAPRFSRSSTKAAFAPVETDRDTSSVLLRWDIDVDTVQGLIDAGVALVRASETSGEDHD
jgi:alpha-methylacyl-CoA racemase